MQEADAIQVGPDVDAAIGNRTMQSFVGLIRFDPGHELIEPTTEQLRGLADRDVNDHGVQHLLGTFLGEPQERLVDPAGPVVVDMPGGPSIPSVGSLLTNPARDAQGSADGVFAGPDRQPDLHGREFTGLVARIAPFAVLSVDASLV